MKFVIVSDGLAGFFLANLLVKKNHDVTLVDTGNEPQTPERFRDIGFSFLPNTDTVRRGLSLLEEGFEMPFEIHEHERAPITVEGHDIKPFVGFGESRSVAVQPLSLFNAPSSLSISCAEKMIIENALANHRFKVLPFSEMSSIQIVGNLIERITINGQTDLEADRYIFLNSPHEILPILPPELVGSKTRTRLAKTSSWARLALRLNHAEPLPPVRELVFLLPNQPDAPPCVGQIDESLHCSTWLTFVPTELADDPAYVADTLKDMRKLVKRSFPMSEPQPKETVAVVPRALADLSWIFENQDLMHIADNLVISPRLATQSVGFSQSVEALSRAAISCYH